MDVIGRAIKRNSQKLNDKKWQNTGWNNFEAQIVNKKLFLFGVGPGVDFYYHKYGESANADGVIDNDRNLSGTRLQDWIVEKVDNEHENIKVFGIDHLKNQDKDNVVILITSLTHFDEIAIQLDAIGIKNYYSLLCMENLYRKQNDVHDIEDSRERYERECREGPINPKRMILLTTHGLSGHGKEIVRQLTKIRNDLEIIWPVNNMNVPMIEGVHVISQKNAREYIHALSTSMIWLTDTGVPNEKRRKGQLVIQMKHWASVTLKMFGYDELSYRKEKDPTLFGVQGLDNIDYVIVGSEFDERTCRSGFHFHGEAIYAGSPRTDILFRKDEMFENLHETYPQLEGKMLLLFAPTYRIVAKGATEDTYSNDMDFRLVKEALERRFGGEWLILLRLHPFVAKMSKDIPHPDYVIDVSDYYDSEELVAVSDALVTDYSSIMFEPAFVKKPVFLLATDKDEYLRKERGFLIDYNTLPFQIAESNEQLAKNIRGFDQGKYEQGLNTFFEKYGVHEDGHAGERAAKFISDLIDKHCK